MSESIHRSGFSLAHLLQTGQNALERDDHAAAVTAFTAARDLAPAQAGVTIALANAHRLHGDTLAARAALCVPLPALASLPAADAYAIGAALLDVGAPYEAARCFEQVLHTLPTEAAALAALAGARRAYGDAGRAWPLIQRALQIAPDQPAFMLVAAQVRHDLGDLRGAMRWLDAADIARPGHTPTRMQRAYTALLGGASVDAWTLFESRALPMPTTNAKPWRGEPLHGASIVVAGEQGMGDQFQFVRFVTLLRAFNPSDIIVECHPDAVALFRASGLHAVARSTAPPTDWHVPMLSLPHRLGLGDGVHGELVPYLRAPLEQPSTANAPGARDESAATGSSSQSASGAALPKRARIGIVWSGNKAYAASVKRDFDTALLGDLITIPDIEWVSLQQGVPDANRVDGLITIPPLSDWSATAAMLTSLDGLVTVDTGIAHLAGALGVPTWIMLPAAPDWRWGLTRDTTPWYPTVRLVRQKRAGDWASVVVQLREGLAAWLRLSRPTNVEIAP